MAYSQNTRLICTNVAPFWVERDIFQLFGPFGTVSKIELRGSNKDGGQLAIVTMGNPQQALEAQKHLHGHQALNVPNCPRMSVKPHFEHQPPPGTNDRYSSSSSRTSKTQGNMVNSRNYPAGGDMNIVAHVPPGQQVPVGLSPDLNRGLYLYPLSENTPEADLASYFQKFGFVESIAVIRDGGSKWYGLLTFRDRQSTQQACAQQVAVINGEKIHLSFANEIHNQIKPSQTSAAPHPNMPPSQNYMTGKGGPPFRPEGPHGVHMGHPKETADTLSLKNELYNIKTKFNKKTTEFDKLKEEYDKKLKECEKKLESEKKKVAYHKEISVKSARQQGALVEKLQQIQSQFTTTKKVKDELEQQLVSNEAEKLQAKQVNEYIEEIKKLKLELKQSEEKLVVVEGLKKERDFAIKTVAIREDDWEKLSDKYREKKNMIDKLKEENYRLKKEHEKNEEKAKSMSEQYEHLQKQYCDARKELEDKKETPMKVKAEVIKNETKSESMKSEKKEKKRKRSKKESSPSKKHKKAKLS